MRRAAVLAAIAVACDALATNHESATLEANAGRTTLTVESSRPVAKAVETLIARYDHAITYEDPRYAFEDDLEDATARVRKDFPASPAGAGAKTNVPSKPQSAGRSTTSITLASLRISWITTGGQARHRV
jgi:hypothetical protein